MNISNKRNSSELAKVLSFFLYEYAMGKMEFPPVIKFTSQELLDLSGHNKLSAKYLSDVNLALRRFFLILLKIDDYWVLSCCITVGGVSIPTDLLKQHSAGFSSVSKRDVPTALQF